MLHPNPSICRQPFVLPKTSIAFSYLSLTARNSQSNKRKSPRSVEVVIFPIFGHCHTRTTMHTRRGNRLGYEKRYMTLLSTKRPTQAPTVSPVLAQDFMFVELTLFFMDGIVGNIILSRTIFQKLLGKTGFPTTRSFCLLTIKMLSMKHVANCRSTNGCILNENVIGELKVVGNNSYHHKILFGK